MRGGPISKSGPRARVHRSSALSKFRMSRQGVFAMARPTRPIFLNPMQIQMPVGAVSSIVHRVTGVLLAASVPCEVYLLDLSLRSEHAFAQVTNWFALPAVKGVVLVLIWALAHHALAGIRHLLTDISIGSTLNAARRSAWWVNLGGVAIALFAAGILL
jgi:succinate dehydrogenase / fumarate reductase, cytochrome b subunit